MPSLSVANVTVNYTVATENNKTTVTITSVTASSTSFSPPKKKKKQIRYVKVLVSNKKVVGVTAKWSKKASSATKARARTDAVLLAITKVNAAHDAKRTSYIFNCGAKAKKCYIKLYVFGHYKSVAFTVPKAVKLSPTSPDPPKDPFDTNDVDDKNGIKKYTTIASVNNGEVFLVNEAAAETYGRIEKVVDFSDVTDPSELKRLGEIYLKSQQFDDLVLKLSAIDLHTLMGDVPAFNLLDQVYCYSEPHGVEVTLPITEMTIKLDQADSVQYTLGETSSSSTMSAKSATNASNFYSKLENLPSAKNTLSIAKERMTTILNQRTTGYVNIVQEDDHSQALVISDDEDWTRSAKLWKWDMNGLGYSDSTKPVDAENEDGPTSIFGNRVYKLGITMDGHMVADFMDTGILSDGVGYNYWDLTTGDFQLRGDADILNLDEDGNPDLDKVSTLSELISKTDASELTAAQANAKSSTSGNVLRATNNFSVLNDASWSKGGWKKSGKGFIKISDIEDKPNPELLKMVSVYTNNAAYPTYVYQTDIPVEEKTVYVLSCWIKGEGTLDIMAGVKKPYRHAKQAVQEAGEWHKYQLVFRTSKKGQATIDIAALEQALFVANTNVVLAKSLHTEAVAQYKIARANYGKNDKRTKRAKKAVTDAKNAYKAKKKIRQQAQKELTAAKQIAYITANKHLTVYFGNIAKGTLLICGMTLARGNSSTNWSTSDTDNRTYVDKITKDDRDFTKSQIEALDQSDSQAKLFSRLTRNGAAKGLFMNNNELYVNATYIYASSMVTDLLRTNLIADSDRKNVWNLATGYFKTRNMEAENLRAEGTFQGGKKTGYHVDFSGQGITSYPPNSTTADTYIGFVRTYNSRSKKYDIANLSLQSRNTLQIFSPHLIVSTQPFKKSNGSYAGGSAGVTKDIKISAVVGTKTNKKTKKKVMNKKVVAHLKFVNGICVYAK